MMAYARVMRRHLSFFAMRPSHGTMMSSSRTQESIPFIRSWLAAALLMGRSRDIPLMALATGATVLMFLAYIARLNAVTHDVFHEMSWARAWLQSGTFPLDDLFAYTPTVSPAVHHEWATGLLLYWAGPASPLGLGGIMLLKFLLVAALGLLLYRVARGQGAHPLIIIALVPIMLPLMWVGFATLRAQLFTLVALAAQMLMLQADWRGRRGWIWFWIPLYIVWLNVHAGFVVGLGMLGFHAIERSVEAVRRGKKLFAEIYHLLALAPVVVAGILCNPWGWDYVPYLWRAIAMERPTILEWRPLWHTYDPFTTLFVFAISILLMGYVVQTRRWSRLRGWLFCCLAAYMAIKHIRHGSLYAVIWLAWMPGWLTPTPLGRAIVQTFQQHRVGWMRVAQILSIACLFFAISHSFWKPTIPTSLKDSSFCFPVEAMDYLERHNVEGNLLTPFHCGAYVSWRLHPAIKVSLDGRYEVAFAEGVMEAHQRFYEAQPGWETMLNRYDHDMILVPRDAKVYPELVRQDQAIPLGWRLLYQDSAFAILSQ